VKFSDFKDILSVNTEGSALNNGYMLNWTPITGTHKQLDPDNVNTTDL